MPAQPVPSSAPLVFEQLPIALSAVEFVVPIGNLNPPGHTLPTDHAYFYHRLRNPSAPRYDVVAPAAGTVRYVTRGADDAIGVQATTTTMYYLGHVLVDAGLTGGSVVAAGQHLGMTSQLSYGLDLGVINDAVTVFFVNPLRYSSNTLHAESPLPYFAEPLRSSVYAKVESAMPANNGRIDFDRAGRLAGNWFLEGLAPSDSSNVSAGPRQLAFVRDVLNPSAVRISVGGTLAMTGVFAIDSGAPDPADVSAASGAIGYRLFYGQAGPRAAGLLMVRMLEDTRAQVEVFADSQDSRTEFTTASQIYVR
ncbi:MAG: hypothetical protein ABI634_05640 [Acidobacteriota bacterium]